MTIFITQCFTKQLATLLGITDPFSVCSIKFELTSESSCDDAECDNNAECLVGEIMLLWW